VSTKFSITDNAVNQHASNLDTTVSALNSNAQAFLSAIEGLPGVWQGSAYQSWDALTSKWNEAMAGLNKAMTDIQGRVGNAGKLYDTYHSEQTDKLQSTTAQQQWDATQVRI
jgi:WXG100 family type VII secretion target